MILYIITMIIIITITSTETGLNIIYLISMPRYILNLETHVTMIYHHVLIWIPTFFLLLERNLSLKNNLRVKNR